MRSPAPFQRVVNNGPDGEQAPGAPDPRRTKVAERDVERQLGDGDLFFSTTDRKGIITAGNDVFERVSGYSLDVLVGANHNILRHSDMPRSVFWLLWDTIGRGDAIAAYVKNRTADGAFYWVMGTVVPVPGGYLSVRVPPTTELFTAAKSIYAELLAVEQAVEGDDVRQRKPSIAAGAARLGEILPTAGFEDYGAFMRHALPAEVAARAARLPDEHRRRLATVPVGAPAGVPEILEAYSMLSEFLGSLVGDLSRYAALGRTLGEHSQYLREMGDDVRLYAVNAQIGASRLGEHGAALDAVARLLTEQSQATSPLVANVAERAGAAVRDLDEMAFELSISAIQAEMVAVFAHQIAGSPEAAATHAKSMLALTDALNRGSERTFASFGSVAQRLSEVFSYVTQVGSGISRLARLSLNGRVELASVPDAGSISTLFSDVERQVGDARARLGRIRDDRSGRAGPPECRPPRGRVLGGAAARVCTDPRRLTPRRGASAAGVPQLLAVPSCWRCLSPRGSRSRRRSPNR